MDLSALLAQALATVKGNQSELARRLGRSQVTVSRWANGQTGIDYESCLRLARLTGLPSRQVVEIAGLDPELLPADARLPSRPPSALELDIQRRVARIQALVDATVGLPADFADVYLRKLLDNTESEIETTIFMVRRLRQLQEVSGLPDAPDKTPTDDIIGGSDDEDGHLRINYLLRLNQELVAQ